MKNVTPTRAGLALLITAGLIGGGWAIWYYLVRTPPVPQVQVEGRVELRDEFFTPKSSDQCLGNGNYGSVAPGSEVVIRDAGGEVLGTTKLGPSQAASIPTSLEPDGVENVCVLLIDPISIPGDRANYTVQVGATDPAEKARVDMRELIVRLGY